MRKPLKLAGLPQTGKLISAASGPKFTILWGRYSRTKLCDGAQISIFGDVFRSCISSELRAARFRPASEIRTKATPCVEVLQTSNLRWLRLGEEKEEETTGKKVDCPIP